MRERINYTLLYFVFVFFLISCLSIYSAAAYTSSALGNLTLKQCVWFIIGITIIFFMIKIKNNFLFTNAEIIYCVILLLLLLLLFIGTPINNSKCWFVIPGIGSIQPSEFMKISIILFLGKVIFNYRAENSHSVSDEFLLILKCFLIVLLPSVLTFLQPDTGSVIIYIFSFAFMMFFAGLRWRWFFLALLGCLLVVGIFGGIYFFNEELFVDIFGTSMHYRIERLFMWQDGSGLQLENALASVGAAGIVGHGFNQIPIYFPEAPTDFIFAVFASSFGFIGVLLMLCLLLGFDLYILFVLKGKNNSIDKYVLVGILGMLIFQQIQNIGMTIGLFPITGITLPYISYGGSSLISYMIIAGIIINSTSEKLKKYS